LLLFRGDRRMLIMSFAVPIAIASFFGYALGGSGEQTDPGRVPVLVSDQDQSAVSRDIITRLSDEKTLGVKPSTPEEAREAIRKGKAMVGVVIPKDFGKSSGRAFFRSEEKPGVALLYDPSHAAERSLVQGVLTGHVMQAVSKE